MIPRKSERPSFSCPQHDAPSGKSASSQNMKAERIVLSFIAILIGLFVAGIVFFVFQITQNKDTEKKQVVSILPSPSPSPASTLLSIQSPENEAVVAEKMTTLEGKAPQGSTIIIATENGHSVSMAEDDGSFSEEVVLDSGVNIIHITAVMRDGNEESVTHTVSYSTESF